ncbi:MAG: hypothetical protein KGI59_00670 [Patescibacteria group bacterium]|nr:hypothetical protein [Patescibacteria group bacterium]
MLTPVLTALIVGTVFVSFMPVNKADAQFGGSVACNATLNITNAVPVYDQSTAALKNVKCTADGIAWQLAHVVLHELTTSVVNWINSGFNGSPAFLSNPQGFFLDVADQATGALIADTGPLAQALCSPFSLDIRLSLALGQVQTDDERYACTLSTVIQAQNANLQRLSSGQPPVSVSVDQSAGGATISDFQTGAAFHNSDQLSVNGQSIATIGGFFSGDFSQGGWQGFLALATEPQNNPYGASLMAQSDLQMQILARQSAINNDLNRGAGFLSWQSCENVPVGGTSGNDYGGETGSGVTNSIQTKQVCQTETPGSVISASLNKQLGAPTDELNLTNEINEVVSALFSQLLTQVLSHGLLSSSQPSMSGTNSISQSYVNQLSNDPALQANFVNLRSQSVTDLDQAAAGIKTAVSLRSQALALMTNVQSSYLTTRACIANKIQNGATGSNLNTSYLQTQLSTLDAYIAENVTPQVAAYQGTYDGANSALTDVNNMESQLAAAATASDLNSLNSDFSAQLSTLSTTSADPSAAQTDLTTATTLSKNLQSALTPYQNICSGVAPSSNL